MHWTLLVAALLSSDAATAPATADPAAGQACDVVAQPWRGAVQATSATNAEIGDARAPLDRAISLTLHPDGEVAYVTLPQGEGEPASFGGLIGFEVAEAGTYRVGVSDPSWVDVAENGRPVEASRFGPGPACSGIRKAVEFELEAGAHILELSGASTPRLGVLIERAPRK